MMPWYYSCDKSACSIVYKNHYYLMFIAYSNFVLAKICDMILGKYSCKCVDKIKLTYRNRKGGHGLD